MLSVKKTMIVEPRLGSNSANITRNGSGALGDTAASTNSFSRRASTSPRIGRAM